METDLLRQLLVIKNTGTLSEAARILHTTQPSLTRNMQKLEYEIGSELFVRTKNRIVLNEKGIKVCEHAAELLRKEQTMIEAIRMMDQKEAAIGSCAPIPMSIVLDRISYSFPETTVISKIEETEKLLKGLLEGQYQMIILPYKANLSYTVSSRICTEKLHISIDKNDPLAQRRDISFAEINGMTFLLNSKIGIWHEIVQTHMPDSRFIMQRDRESLEFLAQQSSLHAFTTDVSIRRNGSRKNRKAIPVTDPTAAVTFWLTVKKEDEEKYRTLFE